MAELVSDALIVLLEVGNKRVHARLGDNVDLVKFYYRLFHENSAKKERDEYVLVVELFNGVASAQQKNHDQKNEKLKETACVT